MNYYKDDRSPARWAAGALAAYVLLTAAGLWFVEVEVRRPEQTGEVVLVDFSEPEPPPRQQPPPSPAPEPRRHEEPAPVEQNNQVRGAEAETRTVNPRALFHQNAGGTDDPADAGNPHAARGEREASAGKGTGLKADGSDQLDKGLQGRGLAGELPRPDYPGNAAGKVVIRVTVDRSGKVTAAVYEPEGSTTSNADLIEAARRAALKARFTESASYIQGGTITYIFKLN